MLLTVVMPNHFVSNNIVSRKAITCISRFLNAGTPSIVSVAIRFLCQAQIQASQRQVGAALACRIEAKGEIHQHCRHKEGQRCFFPQFAFHCASFLFLFFFSVISPGSRHPFWECVKGFWTNSGLIIFSMLRLLIQALLGPVSTKGCCFLCKHIIIIIFYITIVYMVKNNESNCNSS
jgi:hypothetical protein